MQQDINETVSAIETIIKGMVDNPDDVDVTSYAGRQAVMLEVSTNPGDVRRVIGRGGQTADALRGVLFAVGGKRGVRFTLEIVEPHAARVTRPLRAV